MKLQQVSKSFGSLQVLDKITLSLTRNNITCILGPSGCGKTTLLNIISGVLHPDEGRLLGFEGKTISYLFQEPRLLDWKTVWGNLEFILKDKVPKPKRSSLIEHYLKMVELEPFKSYYPSQLSGGMKQRTSIARAFTYSSNIMLMDEPFKGIDLHLKMSLIGAFLKLWQEDHRVVIFVTHDMDEALLLGNEIVFLSSPPTRILETIQVPVPHDSRDLHCPVLQKLKKQMLQCINSIAGKTSARPISRLSLYSK